MLRQVEEGLVLVVLPFAQQPIHIGWIGRLRKIGLKLAVLMVVEPGEYGFKEIFHDEVLFAILRQCETAQMISYNIISTSYFIK